MRAENELIAAAASGDKSAFEELVNRYSRPVFSMALRMTGSPEDAEDLAQEVFIRVYRSIDSFRGDSKFSTWLYRVTSNLCIDFLRKRSHISTLPLVVPDEHGGQIEEPIPDSRYHPEPVFEKEQLRESIATAVLTLSPAHREIFLLRESQDLSYEQISEVLNLEIGTVKSRLARARGAMKEALLKDRNFSVQLTSKEQRGGVK